MKLIKGRFNTLSFIFSYYKKRFFIGIVEKRSISFHQDGNIQIGASHAKKTSL